MASVSTLSLLTLLLASTVAAGVDLADRSGETVVFSVPPLTHGARAVYDVTVLSDFLENGTARGALTIEVEEASHDAGHHDDSFTLAAERTPMPWDAEESALAKGPGKTKAARLTNTTEETVRLADGRVLIRDTKLHDERWRARDGAVRLDEALHHRMDHLPAQEGLWSHLHAHLQTRYAYRDPWIDTLSPADPGEVVVSRARLDGVEVYGLARHHTHDAQRGQGFGCHLAIPQYTYAEASSSGRHAQRPVHVDATETLWISPDHTFPLLAICETTYRAHGPDGALLGTVRVLAHLEDEERGGPAIDVDTDPGPLEPTSSLKPTHRESSGLPADPQPIFRFRLDHAYTTLLESDHEALSAFRGTTTPPFLVLTTTYHPDTIQPECLLIDPLCTLDQEGRERSTIARPTWTFVLQNEHGQQMSVRVERQVAATGEGTPPEVSTAVPLNQKAFPFRVDEIPPKLVPPSEVLREWLEHEELTLERWRDGPNAYFTIHYDRQGDAVVPHYVVHGDLRMLEDEDSLLDKGYDPAEWQGTFSHRYRGSDGILLDHGVDATGIQERPPPPHRPPGEPAVFDAGLTSYAHASTLAIVAGGITLAGVAAALRAGLPDWLRRLLVVPFFTKLSKDQVLDHKTRDEMIAYVTLHPGIGTEEIRRHLGVGWGTAVYHLSALEQNHLLTSLRSGGHRHWFPAQTMDPKTREMLALLRGPAARRLYDAVTRSPGRTQQEIAQELGVTHGAIIFQVRKLERAGLIRKERDGRFVRYHAEPVPSRAPRDPPPRTD